MLEDGQLGGPATGNSFCIVRVLAMALAYKQPGREGRVLHRAPFEQRQERRNLADSAMAASRGGRNHSRLQRPENSSRVRLANRQQPLAGGDQTGSALMQKRQHRGFLVDAERSRSQAECGGVVHRTARVPHGFRRLAQRPAIGGHAEHGGEKILSQGSTAGPAFACRPESAQTVVDLRPPLGGKRLPIAPGQPKCFTAEDRVQHAGLLQIAVQKLRQSWQREQLGINQRFQSEGMRQCADGQGAVGQLQQAQ